MITDGSFATSGVLLATRIGPRWLAPSIAVVSFGLIGIEFIQETKKN